MSNYKIALVDIETFPSVGYCWGKYDQNILEFVRVGGLASFAIKWVGDKGLPTCLALPDFKETYRKDKYDDSELAGVLREVLCEADLVVGHNVAKFDLRKMKGRMFLAGTKPPSPYKIFDTLVEFRRHFDFPSNKLGDLAKFLGCPIGGKMEHEGFQLWIKCMDGDMEAWERMMKYNIKDVRINEWIYHKIAPWTKHPNITLLGNKDNLCPVCGGPTKHSENHWNVMQSYRTKRYQCLKVGCGKWSSGEREKLPIDVLT